MFNRLEQKKSAITHCEVQTTQAIASSCELNMRKKSNKNNYNN